MPQLKNVCLSFLKSNDNWKVLPGICTNTYFFNSVDSEIRLSQILFLAALFYMEEKTIRRL
jgi:hypothetical protein